jgi:hypothetical protein
VRAFIPTGSTNRACLLTLNEDVTDTGGFSSFYCGPRTFQGVPGLFVHIYMNLPAASGFGIGVTVFQPDAQQYGAPILYTDP